MPDRDGPAFDEAVSAKLHDRAIPDGGLTVSIGGWSVFSDNSKEKVIVFTTTR